MERNALSACTMSSHYVSPICFDGMLSRELRASSSETTREHVVSSFSPRSAPCQAAAATAARLSFHIYSRINVRELIQISNLVCSLANTEFNLLCKQPSADLRTRGSVRTDERCLIREWIVSLPFAALGSERREALFPA